MHLETILSKSEVLEIVRLDARGEKAFNIATKQNWSRGIVEAMFSTSRTLRRICHEKQRCLSNHAMRAAGRVTNACYQSCAQVVITLFGHKTISVGNPRGRTSPVHVGMCKLIQLHHKHRDARVEWCADHAHSSSEWNCVIFFDEKKFNLDNPNVYE